jgi:pimeloyl-ACP methyl ester carboxylesterase
VTETTHGSLDYADVGDGKPVLVVHGIFGGRDAGLISFDDLVPHRRVVSPSRFGYLGSVMPPGATPAMQADVFAELLDALAIRRIDVVAFSAGTPSALQFALRHPDRIRHLAVMSGAWPGSFTRPPSVAERIVYRSDLVMWSARTCGGSALLRLIAGIPKDFVVSEEQRAEVDALIDTVFPVHERSTGALFDACTGNLDVDTFPLEDIEVPTLIVHSRDDTLAPFEPARLAAARIPLAHLVAHESGGHLMLGRATEAGRAVGEFLAGGS